MVQRVNFTLCVFYSLKKWKKKKKKQPKHSLEQFALTTVTCAPPMTVISQLDTYSKEITKDAKNI